MIADSTETGGSATPTPDSREELLAAAVKVLTAAARLTEPLLVRDDAATAAAGRPVWMESGQRDPADWAEFVTQALAGAAANIGGIEQVLAGRPGSWEAEGVRQLLTSTVGHDEAYLLEHRTEPVTVNVYVDDVMADLNAWDRYDRAAKVLADRYDALSIPTVTGVPGAPATESALAQLEPPSEEQEQAADAIADLEDRLEKLRQADWAAYGSALKANIEAAAHSLALRVPLVVNVDLDTPRQGRVHPTGLAERLLAEAVEVTPLPGDGRAPLERLSQ